VVKKVVSNSGVFQAVQSYVKSRVKFPTGLVSYTYRAGNNTFRCPMTPLSSFRMNNVVGLTDGHTEGPLGFYEAMNDLPFSAVEIHCSSSRRCRSKEGREGSYRPQRTCTNVAHRHDRDFTYKDGLVDRFRFHSFGITLERFIKGQRREVIGITSSYSSSSDISLNTCSQVERST
jgi:hypothetical protein